MATVKLYTNTSDNRYITKSITQVGTDLSCSFKENTTQEDPVIIISPTAYSHSANYCYISDTGRYYYITNVTFSQQRCYLHLKVDVLMSFGAAIKLCNCIATRSNSKYNMYLNDNKYDRLEYSNVFTKPFPNGFSKNLEYVLIVGG